MNLTEKFQLVLVKYDFLSDQRGAEEVATQLSNIEGVRAIAVPKGFDYQTIEVNASPTRRVFHIDIGDMPPSRAKDYLEKIKTEISATFDPGKASENIFLASSRSQDRGSSVSFS